MKSGYDEWSCRVVLTSGYEDGGAGGGDGGEKEVGGMRGDLGKHGGGGGRGGGGGAGRGAGVSVGATDSERDACVKQQENDGLGSGAAGPRGCRHLGASTTLRSARDVVGVQRLRRRTGPRAPPRAWHGPPAHGVRGRPPRSGRSHRGSHPSAAATATAAAPTATTTPHRRRVCAATPTRHSLPAPPPAAARASAGCRRDTGARRTPPRRRGPHRNTGGVSPPPFAGWVTCRRPVAAPAAGGQRLQPPAPPGLR